MKMAPVGIICAFCALALPREAVGQESSPYRNAGIQGLEASALGEGARVRVSGKYKELIDKDILLFDCKATFRIARQEHFKKLLEFRTKRDNLTLDAQVVSKDGSLIFETEAITAAPSDLQVFTGQAEALSRGAPGGEAAKQEPRAALDLLEKILSACDRFGDKDLLPLARQVFLEGLPAKETALDGAAVKERLEIIRRMRSLGKDTSSVLGLILSLKDAAPGNGEVDDLLESFKCRQYGGKWVTYEEFKRLEGFVQHGGQWISMRERHLAEAMDRSRAAGPDNLLLRKRTDRDYGFLAEKGALEEGMKPEEVQIALGFPDRVERRSIDGKEFVQWTYGSKHCYFHDGILLTKPEAER